MKYCRVIGTVWAERKVESLSGCRLLVVQPIRSTGEDMGSLMVAADPKRLASTGDYVVVVTNTDATQAFPGGYAPVNASVVELVDSLD